MQQGLGNLLATPAAFVAALGLFDSTCNVQEATNAVDSAGQVDLTASGFATIPGCSAIACMRSPASASRILATEQKAVTLTEALNLFHVLLDGYFPQIPEALARTGQVRAIIDGVPHEVLGVEPSSQLAAANQMRMEVRQVTI